MPCPALLRNPCLVRNPSALGSCLNLSPWGTYAVIMQRICISVYLLFKNKEWDLLYLQMICYFVWWQQWGGRGVVTTKLITLVSFRIRKVGDWLLGTQKDLQRPIEANYLVKNTYLCDYSEQAYTRVVPEYPGSVGPGTHVYNSSGWKTQTPSYRLRNLR